MPRPLRRAAAPSLFLLVALASLAPSWARAARPAVTPPQLSEQLSRSMARLATQGNAELVRERLAGRVAPSSLDVLVVGVDFSDSLLWGRDLSQFPGWPEQRRTGDRIVGTDIPMFAAHDSVFFDVQMQRVADYFGSVSRGRFELRWQVHGELINVGRPMGYYGDDDSSSTRLSQLSAEVVARIDDDVDFSGFDTLVLIHAGAGRETDILGDSPEQIFSNYLDRRDFEEARAAGYLDQPSIPTAEGPLEHVIVLPESESQDPLPAAGLNGFFGKLGVYCFEFGLRLGMLNLSDFTPSGRPDSQGIGNFGLMGYGLFNGVGLVPAPPCAMNRWLMGWVDAVDVTTDADLRLAAINEAAPAAGDTLLLRVPIDDRQYWLVEYRLQDPDGDLFFDFSDSNGNLIPDFWDADSATGDGRPSSSFDPATDVWESTLGAEWDFFTSDSSARTPDRCMRGGGSGLLIWHVDEAVIARAVLGGETNPNDDAQHKGVDLEEADGIQDLDRLRPDAFFLGWDGDAWRGEGADRFGPGTLPATSTADGTPTGVLFSGIGKVVQDSLPKADGICTGFVYHPSLPLRVEFGRDSGAGAQLAASLPLEPFPTRWDVRLADLDAPVGAPSPDPAEELVLAAEGGAVLAFRGGLTEYADGDGNPATTGVLAVYTDGGGSPREWLGPPAVGEVDGVGGPEIVLASPRAAELLSPNPTGGAVSVDSRTPRTTAARPDLVLVGPILMIPQSATGLGTGQAGIHDLFYVGHERESDTAILIREVFAPSYQLPPQAGSVRGIPASGLLASPRDGWFLLPWTDDEGAGVHEIDGARLLDHASWRLDGGFAAGMLPASVEGGELFYPAGEGRLRRSSVGGDVTTGWPGPDPATRSTREGIAGLPPAGSAAAGPRRPGGPLVVAWAAGGELWALDGGLRPLDGFPYRPGWSAGDAIVDSALATPLLVDLDGDDEVELIWHDPAGRLHAVDLRGSSLPGWPVPGPASPAASPAVGDVDGDGEMELVAAGHRLAIRSLRPPELAIDGERVGELRVYDLPGVPATAHAPWRQGRGGPTNAGRAPAAGPPAAPGGGSLVESSLALQPNPVRGDHLRVRVQAARDGLLVARAYNLEGELVASSPQRFTAAGEWFDERIPLPSAAGGLYLCQVEGAGDRIDAPFAVAR